MNTLTIEVAGENDCDVELIKGALRSLGYAHLKTTFIAKSSDETLIIKIEFERSSNVHEENMAKISTKQSAGTI